MRTARLPPLALSVLLMTACADPDPPSKVAAGVPSPPAGWCRQGKPTVLAAQAIALLRAAGEQGLLPSDYGAEALAVSRRQLSTAATPPPGEAAKFERDLDAAFAGFLTDVHRGRIDARAAGFDYHAGERHRIADLIAGAQARGDLAGAVAEVEPPYTQYRRLKAALARGPGREDARRIGLALERLRWLPHAPAGRFLVANVPAFRLVALEGARSERPSLVSAIVVGTAARARTPLFADAVRTVIFRPFWYPPRSLIVNEIAPLLASDPGSLARERFDLVARGADDAPALPPTPENIARLAAGSLQIRQKPGPDNALGLVKFAFPNRYDVYLHDTPATDLFARPRRDFSHGCIRVEKAAELASLLLDGKSEWSLEKIRAAMHGGRTFRVDLPEPVPLFLYYTTAVAHEDGSVEFFEDIYGLDETLERALGDTRGVRHAPLGGEGRRGRRAVRGPG